MVYSAERSGEGFGVSLLQAVQLASLPPAKPATKNPPAAADQSL